MQNRHTTDILLKTDSVDLTERWSIASVLSGMQLAADNHAVILGAGKKQITQKGLYWVIARTRVDMRRYPVYGDTVTIATWPGEPDRLTFPRYFNFLDEGGRLLGTATVRYMLIDSATHSFVLPGKAEIYPKEMEIFSDINPQPEKIRFNAATREIVFRAPAYSDIDLNRHMNNTRYAQWVCDLFPTSIFENNVLKKFQINYVSDGVEAHRIAMSIQEDAESGVFIVTGADIENDKRTVFECSGEWMRV